LEDAAVGAPLQGPQKFKIAKNIPDKEEIATTVGYLHTGTSPGPSSI